MKKYFSILFLVFCISACANKYGGVAAPVDPEKLEAAAKTLCPANQTFQISTDETRIGPEIPSKILFAIQKGSGSCASLHNIDHGGLTSWLNVTYSTDCILNGSLWAYGSMSIVDSNNVYFRLKSLDPNENNWILIYTNYGYRMSELRSKMGLITYTCTSQ